MFVVVTAKNSLIDMIESKIHQKHVRRKQKELGNTAIAAAAPDEDLPRLLFLLIMAASSPLLLLLVSTDEETNLILDGHWTGPIVKLLHQYRFCNFYSLLHCNRKFRLAFTLLGGYNSAAETAT